VSFPVHEVIVVHKILATLWFGTIRPFDPAVEFTWHAAIIMHCNPQLSQGLTVDEKRGLTAAHCVCSSVLLINNGTAEKDSRKTIKAQNPTLRLLTIYSKVYIYVKETKKVSWLFLYKHKWAYLEKDFYKIVVIFFGLVLGNESVPTELRCENVRKCRKIKFFSVLWCNIM